MKSIRLIGGYFAAVAAVSILTLAGSAGAMEAENKVEAQKLDPKTEVKKEPVKKEEAKKPVEKKQESKNSKETKYAYTANYGDTYIQIVRKAVQTYGILNNKDLGQARIVAIETTVASKHGFPYISQGQKVSFNESEIKSWVDEAMKMPANQIAAWQAYVPYINFNTDHVAEK